MTLKYSKTQITFANQLLPLDKRESLKCNKFQLTPQLQPYSGMKININAIRLQNSKIDKGGFTLAIKLKEKNKILFQGKIQLFMGKRKVL